jgi:hypothetical protein
MAQEQLKHLRRHGRHHIVSHDRTAGIVARDNEHLDTYGNLDVHGFAINNLRLIRVPSGQFLTISGNSLLSGDITISGSCTVGGAVTLSGTVTINGLLEALGGLVVQTSLSIETKTDFNDNALDNVGPITGSGGTLNVVGGLNV